MEKSTAYLIVAIILSITILGVAGEYFSYKYYSLMVNQQVAQTQLSSPSPSPTPQGTAQNSTGSSENLITSFNFSNPMAVGSIDSANHVILLTLPPDSDVTKLQPTIGVSQYATVSPASGVSQDFTNPVTYAVTAQNGSAQNYTVTVNVASILKSTGKLITSFKLLSFKPAVEGYIDNGSYSIMAVVPDGTDLTKITPAITASDGATVSPLSGTAQDFTNPVTYTVKDVYGNIQNYTVTVVTESNSG